MVPDHIEFTKMTAGGNDFLCIDNTRGSYDGLLASEGLPEFVRTLCRRGLAIGADGILVACQLGTGDGVDIVARFLEPDGSEARLCGNGTACFTAWILSKQLVEGPHVDILTAAGAAHGHRVEDDPTRVRVCVPDPRNLAMRVSLRAGGRDWDLDVIDTGVPHAVAYVPDVEVVNVARWGAAIRHAPQFADVGGVNANFAEVVAEGELRVRTYEFGVEGETLACGTGSSAAAILAARRFGWPSRFGNDETPVHVRVRGGETLRIWFVCQSDGNVTDVCLETRPVTVYHGVLDSDLLTYQAGLRKP